MVKKLTLTLENFERLLNWLNPDHERAGQEYEDIRDGLVSIFIRRGCDNAEELADEVIDRVARRIMEGLDKDYTGVRAPYFYGVARKLILEQPAKTRRSVPLSDTHPIAAVAKPEPEELAARERMFECLDRCLRELGQSQRELVTQYYQNEKQEKIVHRKTLATRLGISIESLRVQVLRIRGSLRKCIARNCPELVHLMK